MAFLPWPLPCPVSGLLLGPLIKEEDLAGKMSMITLADSSHIICCHPVAIVNLHSPFVYSRVEVVVMECFSHDVLIGNAAVFSSSSSVELPVYAKMGLVGAVQGSLGHHI